MRDCNRMYREERALHERDGEPEGFRWIIVDDRADSVFAWTRLADGAQPVVVVSNFTPVPRPDFRIGLPAAGRWREVLNTDSVAYGGSNAGNAGVVVAERRASHGFGSSARVTLPPLATLWLIHEGE